MTATATATATKTSLENKHLGNGDYFVIIASCCIVNRARCKWTGRSVVEINIEKDVLLCVHIVVKP